MTQTTAISCIAGDTASISLAFTDPDTLLPVDLTGRDVWLVIAEDAAQDPPTLSLVSRDAASDGVWTVSALAGTATATLTPAQTLALTREVYVTSAYLTPHGSPDDAPVDRRTALRGTLTVSRAARA